MEDARPGLFIRSVPRNIDEYGDLVGLNFVLGAVNDRSTVIESIASRPAKRTLQEFGHVFYYAVK
jgi:hypothetical protein